MKIQLFSDIHLEFQDFTPPQSDADVIVLAGDIHTKGRAVAWAEAHFTKPVILVAGNHDYWGGNVDLTIRKMKAEAAGKGIVHVLENDTVVLNGVRFFGATFWTDFDIAGKRYESMMAARRDMYDYKKIRHGEGYHRFVPEKALRLHEQSRIRLKEVLATPFDGKTVVVTHHGPSAKSLEHGAVVDLLDGCYASNMEDLFGEQIALWVHGHVHVSHDYTINGTRVVCNPRGYLPKWPNPNFEENLILLPD